MDKKTFYTIFAYAIFAIGPSVGTYIVIKNSGKVMGSLAGAVGKVGKWGTKQAGKFAKEKYDRGQFATMRRTSKAFKDQAAQERAYSSGSRRGKLGAILGGTMPWDKKGNKKLQQYSDQQRDKIYQEEVKAADASIQRHANAAYGVDNAQNFLREEIARGASKAEIHAATSNLLAQNGGGSTLKELLGNDSELLKTVAGSDDMWNGVMKAAAGDSKFLSKHTDAKNAIINQNPLFRQAAQEGWSGNFLGDNFRADAPLLDKDGHTVDSGEIDQNTGLPVPVKVANGTEKGWGWVGERSHMVLASHQSNAASLYSDVTYQAALQAKSAIDNGADGGADPLIKAMVLDIVAAGAPTTPGAKNNYVAPTDRAQQPEWYTKSTVYPKQQPAP